MNDLNEIAHQAYRQEDLGLLMKCRDSMLEVIRLTGENLKLSQDNMKLESEVNRLHNILDYLINRNSRGH